MTKIIQEVLTTSQAAEYLQTSKQTLLKNMESQKSFEKGIAVLRRCFINTPSAFSSLMNNLLVTI